MNPQIFNFRKVLPSLTLGVIITLLAALFNFLIYDRRLPAQVVGNQLLHRYQSPEEAISRHPVRAAVHIAASLVNRLDNVSQDIMFAVRGDGHFPSTKNKIVLVDIDEESIIRHGSWPWFRTDIARLMDKSSDAKVIGLDLIFPEPSRRFLPADTEYELDGEESPSPGDPTQGRRDSDYFLAQRITDYPTVLGMVLLDSAEPATKPQSVKSNHFPQAFLPDGKPAQVEDVLLKSSRYVITNVSTLRDTQPQPNGEGFMNVFPSLSGGVRSIPLFAHVRDTAFSVLSGRPRQVMPSFALEVVRVSLGGNGYRINLRGDRVYIPEYRDGYSNGNRYVVESVSILHDQVDILTIPLNELAEMEVGFRSHRDDFTVLPAWEVLAGKHDGKFTDKVVVIGSSVAGNGYIVSTGLPDNEASIPELHASMLSAMLKGDFMDSGYRHDFAWQQVAILACGLGVTMAILFGEILGGMLTAALSILAMTLGTYFFFFKQGLDVGVTLPILSTLAVLGVLLISNYFVVGRERRFIRKAFQLNVSPSILGYLETHPDRLSSLQGEHRHVTVMFTDIRGFTSIAEKMSSQDLARFLNEYFTPMSDIVMSNMGTVDKFIGDGLMAFWNAPADNPHHARDAARASLDMLAKLEELQPDWTARGLPRVSIGCGINTGAMFSGYMGSEQRKNYTVMGDNVNIASRLESLNKTYSSSILITENTRKELGNEFITRVTDKVRVSGKETAVLIYELLGTGPASEERMEELAAFARVFELYQEREFATAESLLKELVFIRPAPIYKMYLDRLAIYKALPPPAGWDGTFSMTHK